MVTLPWALAYFDPAIIESLLDPQYNLSHNYLINLLTIVLVNYLINYHLSQVFLLLLDTGVCYLLLLLSPPRLVHLTVFWWAMIFMSVSHIYRMYTDYNG